MTPLPRWVYLAFLLVVVTSDPVDHACVQLCRTRNTSPEMTGGCEYQQKLVLQFSGGRFPIQRLFRLCLTPCQGSSSTNSFSFDVSQACTTFRNTLIKRHGCSCDSLHDVRTKNYEEDDLEVEKYEKNQLNRPKGSDLPKKFEKERTVSSLDDLSRLTKMKEIVKDTMEIVKTGENTLDDVTGVEDTVDKSNTGSPMEGSSGESSIDWDLWCMAQCDNGKGGSACNCDIIP